MAKDSSFDVVSQVDMQEMDNAVIRLRKKSTSVMISVAAMLPLSWARRK